MTVSRKYLDEKGRVRYQGSMPSMADKKENGRKIIERLPAEIDRIRRQHGRPQ